MDLVLFLVLNSLNNLIKSGYAFKSLNQNRIAPIKIEMDTFCLKWNDFEENRRNFFGKLRNEKHLFDVTLVAGDGYRLKAHKIILSSGSLFFKQIFDENEEKTMLVYIKGMTVDKLNNTIDFIYNGQVDIAQNELEDFLDTANDLKLMGLEMQNQNQTTIQAEFI